MLTRRRQAYRKLILRSALEMLLLASWPLFLTSCADQGVTPPPAARTESLSPNPAKTIRPLSCNEFKPVVGHAGKVTADGKDDVAKADVLARLDLPDWEAQLRRLFGDTSDTLKANAENNAAWRALCQ